MDLSGNFTLVFGNDHGPLHLSMLSTSTVVVPIHSSLASFRRLTSCTRHASDWVCPRHSCCGLQHFHFTRFVTQHISIFTQKYFFKMSTCLAVRYEPENLFVCCWFFSFLQCPQFIWKTIAFTRRFFVITIYF